MYVLGNPIRYTDPTGHMLCGPGNEDDGPECVAKDPNYYNPIKNPQNFGHAKNSGDYHSVESSGSSLDLMSEFWNITGLTPEFACAKMLGSASNPACNPANWSNAVSQFNAISSSANSQAASYIPDAFGVGVGGIAGYFPAQGTGGVDVLYATDENAVTIYGYKGMAINTAGGGLLGGPYAIVGWNIHNSNDYAGVSNSVNLSVAYGHGATVTYFWSGDTPLKPGAPQGITLGYSPGLGADAAYSNVNYTPWFTKPITMP